MRGKPCCARYSGLLHNANLTVSTYAYRFRLLVLTAPYKNQSSLRDTGCSDKQTVALRKYKAFTEYSKKFQKNTAKYRKILDK